jgi:flagellar hook-associated protein 3 FlgL
VQAAVGDGLAAVDGGLDRVLAVRTRLGEQLKLLDSRDALSEDASLAIAQQLSGLVDADYAKSASDLARHQALLQAALKTYASIGGLSLFDYL